MLDKSINIDTEVILKYLRNEASSEEIRQLQLWISLSEENEKNFQEIRNIWEISVPAFHPEAINTQNALLKVKGRIEKATAQSPKKEIRRGTTFMQYFQRIAAILILPALIALSVVILVNQDDGQRLAYNEVMAPYGLVSAITLPDGSKVWLNAGSSLKYPTTFTGHTREVEMSGEVYFEVHADKTHPFIVNTGNLKVTATGTAFNISSFAKSKEEIVTLVSGKVDVSHQKQVKQLLPGQQLSYEKQSTNMEVTDIDTSQFSSWKDGVLAFRDDPLKSVFSRLEQTYHVHFVLKDPSVSQYTYRATFKNETLDDILNYMEITLPVNFKKVDLGTTNDTISVLTVEVYKD